MKARLAVVVDEIPTDPERAALAQAIEQRNQFEQNCTALKEAEGVAWDRIYRAKRAHAAAVDALTHAKEAAADQIVNLAMGRAAEDVPTVDTARRQLTDAEDALEVARAAEDARKRRLISEEQKLGRAQDEVLAGARSVLAKSEAVQRLPERAARLQAEMVDAGLALVWLAQNNAVRVPAEMQEPRTEASRAIFHIRSLPEIWNDLLRSPSIPGAKPWEDALAALMRDATAPVPV